MNNRQKEIIRILLDRQAPHYLVSQLAEKVNCSEKTIRNELKKIEEYLVIYPSACLIRKQGVGVKLEIESAEEKNLYRELVSSKEQISDEDRLVAIAYELLMASHFIHTKSFADTFFVTKAVIKKDMERIQNWLQKYDLELIIKQKNGLKVEGEESNKRKALACISKLVNNYELTKDFIVKQFTTYEVDSVRKELKKVVEKYSLPFTVESQERLVEHTLLVVKKVKLKQVTFFVENKDHLIDKEAYRWTQEFLVNLEKVFTMKFPLSEIMYMTVHFLGAKIQYGQELKTKEFVQMNENETLKLLVGFLMREMSKKIIFDFEKDEYLIKGMEVHLYSALNRIKYGLSVTNPLLTEIKSMYPYMYNSLIIVLNDFEELTGLIIPEEEVGYMTLHFQASIERRNRYERAIKRVAIICQLGIGMSQLLRAKVERKFENIQIIGCYSSEDLPSIIEKENLDFIISTVNLSQALIPIPVIQISSLFDKEEEKRFIYFVENLKDRKEMMNESMIMRYTNPFLVFLQCDEKMERLELIRHFAEILYNRGYVQDGYIENIVEREKTSSTTIGSQIAIPHGHPKYVNESVILIATLKKPMKWENEEVSLVLMLAIQQENQDTLQKLFQEILKLSEQPKLVHKIAKETSSMKVLKMLSEQDDLIEN